MFELESRGDALRLSAHSPSVFILANVHFPAPSRVVPSSKTVAGLAVGDGNIAWKSVKKAGVVTKIHRQPMKCRDHGLGVDEFFFPHYFAYFRFVREPHRRKHLDETHRPAETGLSRTRYRRI